MLGAQRCCVSSLRDLVVREPLGKILDCTHNIKGTFGTTSLCLVSSILVKAACSS